MVKFVVYDANGNILRRGSCRDKDLLLQARPGEQVMEIPKDMEISNEQYFEVQEGKLRHSPSREAAVKAASAAAKKAGDDRVRARIQLLQDIIDRKGTVDERLANLAKVLRGDI
jgi:hypothetical protein